MPVCNRNSRRWPRCKKNAEATVITDRRDRHNAPETIQEELYNAANENILMLRCCDSLNGCSQIDARRRCSFWPSFAHPRWLTCSELNNRRIR